MLGVDGLDIAMLIADADMVEAAVHDLLGRSQLLSLSESNKSIQGLVRSQVKKWQRQVKKHVTHASQTQELQQELALYQQVIHWSEQEFIQQVDSLLDQLAQDSDFFEQGFQLVNANYGRDNPMLPYYFCQQWYKSLVEAVKQAQAHELEKQKEQQVKDLYQRMQAMQQMQYIAPLEENNTIAGRLWDMSAAKLSKSDWSVLKQQADFIKKHPKLLEIAQLLGRMASADNEDSLTHSSNCHVHYELQQSAEAKDDIVGIHQSDDLNQLLPSEIMLLAYPELEVVFYKNLADKQLLNYKMSGKTRKITTVIADKPNESRFIDEQGPFIICVDASGSMRGFPEQCCKAMAFALMQIALAEKRDCYTILFSTDQVCYELTRADGLREASDFLSYTFHGGTDLEPAIASALHMMGQDKYRNADLLVMSDFIAPKHSKPLQQQVEQLKHNKNRFHAISLSKYGNPEVLALFDNHWAYKPGLAERLIKQ